MTDYSVATYATAVLAATAIGSIANTVRIDVVPFMESGKQKFMVITGGNYA